MKARTVLIWTIVLVLAALAIGLILEPRFSDPMAIHWNEKGEADGYGSRFMGLRFNMFAMMIPAFGGFFYYIGVMMEKAKRNYFIGVRNPWTLANEEVWDETHRIGAKGFKLSGVLTLLGWFSLV